MKDSYIDTINELPQNAHKPRGRAIWINYAVESDHTGYKFTRRSQNGIILYFNSAPIIFYSRWKNTVDIPTVGSEFASLIIASELIMLMRYKLRIFGIPIDRYADVFCDNESVYRKYTFDESKLDKNN